MKIKAIDWEKRLPNTSAKRFLSRIYKGHSKLNGKRNNAMKRNGQSIRTGTSPKIIYKQQYKMLKTNAEYHLSLGKMYIRPQ